VGGSGVSSSEVVVGDVACQGWWLVVDADHGPGRIVAGPFSERADAAWAAASDEEHAEDALPVYGFRRADGGLNRRPSPQEWTWLAHLGEQLERLPDDWDAGLSDDHPLGTLAVEVTAALAEAGLPLYDTTSACGGVCLTPEPALDGVLASWRQHDRTSLDLVHGVELDGAVQGVMNRALADVLALRGFALAPFGEAGGSVVRWVA
jgi:hypothetical protein